MSDHDRERAHVQAMRDQLWSAIKDRCQDVFRIGLEGPDGSEQDAKLVRQVFCVVGGDMFMELADFDDPTPPAGGGDRE